MNGSKPSTPSFKKLSIVRQPEAPYEAMNPDSAMVTKAPIDLFKTCIIFVFPALGGLLFGKYTSTLLVSRRSKNNIAQQRQD